VLTPSTDHAVHSYFRCRLEVVACHGNCEVLCKQDISCVAVRMANLFDLKRIAGAAL
jgi:hypothetical protein